MSTEFSGQFLEHYSNIKFYDNPLGGGRVHPCGQEYGLTDRHDETNSRSSQFCERA
jgi:hypothetical protein